MRPQSESLPTPRPEADEAKSQESRRSFLQRSVATTSAVVPAILLASSPPAQAQSKVEPQRKRRRPVGPFPNPSVIPSLYPGWNRKNFNEIRQHEENHVDFLVEALGPRARPRPTFRRQDLLMPDVETFVLTSRALENTGVGAYLGALPHISNIDFIAAAGTIALIEARHAGYLNTLTNVPISQNILNEAPPREVPLTQAQVLASAQPFIAMADFHGFPVGFDTNERNAENDLDILNFALALEYLERDFYDLNVPRFLHLMP